MGVNRKRGEKRGKGQWNGRRGEKSGFSEV